MKLHARAMVAGAVTLITITICFVGVRAELARGHRSVEPTAPHVAQLKLSEADRYCAQRIADGC